MPARIKLSPPLPHIIAGRCLAALLTVRRFDYCPVRALRALIQSVKHTSHYNKFAGDCAEFAAYLNARAFIRYALK